MKYPKIIKTEIELEFPLHQENGGKWIAARLHKNGTHAITGHAEHHTKESCQIVCKAYNNRVGFTDKEVKKILKKYKDVIEKEKTKKRKKG